MAQDSIETIVRALAASEVRYLIVGGVAVVAHGYARLTADVDVVLDTEPANVRKALAALEGLGYRPVAPVRLEEFADSAARARWAREKGMVVFTLWSDRFPATEVDLFLEPPLDFEPAWRNAARLEIAPGVIGVFVGFDDLVKLKLSTGRAKDLDDVETLRRYRRGGQERGTR